MSDTVPRPFAREGEVISLPFYENEKFVVGVTRAGGMGSVYQLIPLASFRPKFALKTYHVGADRAGFAREAKVWISLGDHTNIARAYSYGSIDGTKCILADWYDRGLRDLDPRRFSALELLSFASAIISGLEHAAFRLELIHKDIKPSNILIDKKGNPRISDFGISAYTPALITNPRDQSSPFDRTKSEGHQVLSGTPRYMAPELFAGAPASVQTDIYSLGATLFEWLMDCHPHITDRGLLDLASHKSVRSQITSTYGKESAPLASLIAYAVEPDPANRPSSYESLLSAAAASRSTNSPSVPPKVSEIVATARTLREQGNTEGARHLLQTNLQVYPNDPVLLNAYGSLFLSQGQAERASEIFRKAINAHKSAQIGRDPEPYPDPYLNLANIYRRNRDFDAAASVIRESREYLTGIFEAMMRVYWEYAWLDLMDGDPERACDAIMIHFFRATLSEPALSIFLISASLTDDTPERCNKCFDAIANNAKPSLAECQHLSIMGTYLDTTRRRRLLNDVFTAKTGPALRELGVKLANDAELFRIPMQQSVIAAIVRGMDDEYTGGKYYDAL